MAFISVLVLVVVLSLTTAITLLECGCSPSNRGYRSNVLTELEKSRNQIIEFSAVQLEKVMQDPSLKFADVKTTIDLQVVTLWKSCLANYRHEECVNADTKLRLCEKGKECTSFCKYNPSTWVNTLDGKATASCDKSPILSSEDPSIIAGKPERRTEVRPSSALTQKKTKTSPRLSPEPTVPVQRLHLDLLWHHH